MQEHSREVKRFQDAASTCTGDNQRRHYVSGVLVADGEDCAVFALGLERMWCEIDPDKTVREEAELDVIARGLQQKPLVPSE